MSNNQNQNQGGGIGGKVEGAIDKLTDHGQSDAANQQAASGQTVSSGGQPGTTGMTGTSDSDVVIGGQPMTGQSETFTPGGTARQAVGDASMGRMTDQTTDQTCETTTTSTTNQSGGTTGTSTTNQSGGMTDRTAGSTRNLATGDDVVDVPVMEEQLVAGTRQEEIGRVHVHKDVVSEQETLNVPVQREQVTVDRVPVNQPVDMATAQDAFKGEDIDVPVMGEEAVASKQPREVEELRLHKQDVTENQQVTGTVRREEVRVTGDDGVVVDDQGTTRPTRN